MSRRKRTPEISKLARTPLVAFARKSKDGGDRTDDEPRSDKDASDRPEKKIADTRDVGDAHDVADQTDIKDSGDVKETAVRVAQDELPPITDLPPGGIDRSRADTVGMPAIAIGTPPEVPAPAAVAVQPGDVEEPTFMPGPREVPSGNPDDPAPAPGRVPSGDSRSLRKRGDRYEFALVYRLGNAVISRFGVVGTRGVWRVVEYPTSASASHAYAKECSRFVSEGFSDYRE